MDKQAHDRVEPTMTGPEDLAGALSEILRKARSTDYSPLSVGAIGTSLVTRQYECLRLMKKLGPRYGTCSFDNYEVYEETAPVSKLNEKIRKSQREVFNEIMKLARDLCTHSLCGGGLVLHGRPGTGKDHLMAALMYVAVLQHGWNVHWVNGLELYQEARAVVMGDGSEARFMAGLTNPQILAISDPLPPKDGTTPYQAEVVQRIVDHRYRYLRPTWCTLNVRTGEEADERLGAAIIDRLRHGSLCLQCDWETSRKASND